MSQDQATEAFRKALKENVILQFTDFRVKGLWDKACVGLSMPTVAIYLLKHGSVNEIYDIVVDNFSDKTKTYHNNQVRAEYSDLKNEQEITKEKRGNLRGLCIPYKDFYVILVDEKPTYSTIDDIIVHELRHVVEYELKRAQKQGHQIIYNGQTIDPKTELFLNKDL